MRTSNRLQKPRAAVVAAALLALMPVALSARLPALDALSPGMWVMRERDSGAREQICVRTGREFIQLRHPQSRCSQYLISSTPDEVVVQYACRGEDYGRTTIRRESPELIQIDSQGARGGIPFAVHGEARRSGRC